MTLSTSGWVGRNCRSTRFDMAADRVTRPIDRLHSHVSAYNREEWVMRKQEWALIACQSYQGFTPDRPDTATPLPNTVASVVAVLPPILSSLIRLASIRMDWPIQDGRVAVNRS